MPLPLIAAIATAGGNSGLRETLRSLAACETPDGYLKTVVVENGQRAGAEAIVHEIAAEFPGLACEYRFAEPANKSYALNEVLATLDRNHLVFLTDDDIEFDPGVLRAFADAAAGEQSGFVYGGPVRVRSTGEAPEAMRDFLPPSATGFPVRDYREGDDFLGANWAAFSEDLKAAGGFDFRFGPGSPLGATGQESEMMRQLRRRGLRFRYVPEAIVWHSFDASGYSTVFLGRRSYRNGVEHGQRMRLRHEEGESVPYRWDLAKSRLYATLLPVAVPIAKAVAPARWHARLVASLNAARGRLTGWSAVGEIENLIDRNCLSS